MFDPNRVPAVTVMDAHRQLHEGGAARPLLVDVREAHEFAAVRAEGATLFPLSTFAARLPELPTDRPLLMICQSGARSARATAFLLANGWTDVANVAGGTAAWVLAGLPARRGPLDPGEGVLPA